MRIAIVYNQPEPAVPGDHWLSRSHAGDVSVSPESHDAAEFGVLGQVDAIERHLRELGYDVDRHGVVDAAGLAGFLTRTRPTAVFNCCESVRGVSTLEMSVAAMFDLCGVAYTGSPALTLGMALDKGLTKSLLRAHGVPTPPYIVVESGGQLGNLRDLHYPLIVKPVAEDASIGIDAGAVVHDGESVARRVRFVWEAFQQPALVEEFIEGREFNVALLAGADGRLAPLPISEVSLDAVPAGIPAILSYEAKWMPGSVAHAATPVRCPAALDETIARRVRQLALDASRAVGVSDYGRVDLRLRSRDQQPFVLEVNPNPDLSSDAGFMRASVASGRTMAATVQQILSRALDRAQQTPRRKVSEVR